MTGESNTYSCRCPRYSNYFTDYLSKLLDREVGTLCFYFFNLYLLILTLYHKLHIIILKTHYYMIQIYFKRIHGNEYAFLFDPIVRGTFQQLIWKHIVTEHYSCKCNIWQHFYNYSYEYNSIAISKTIYGNTVF